MHASLQDRDMVVMVAVILVLIAIVLVCCKQTVPAAIIVVFTMMLLALAMDSSGKVLVKEYSAPQAATAARVNKTKTFAPAVRVNTTTNMPPMYLPIPPGVYNNTMSQVVPKPDSSYCSAPGLAQAQQQLDNAVPIKDVTLTNVPVMQNDPHQAPKKCTINSAYTQYNPPPINSTASNTYQDLYVIPTDISRPPGKAVAQVQAKTNIECIKKELGAFPKPDRMQGNDVFLGSEPLLELEITKSERLKETNSTIEAPSGSSTLTAALDVSPPPRPNFNYVKPLPDHDKEMKRKIRNEGLYGIQGDLNCLNMRRSAVANTGFIQPIQAREEFLRYLAYDMPNYKNQWQTARSNTVNSDTRYFK
jgi:hypothetical protein